MSHERGELDDRPEPSDEWEGALAALRPQASQVSRDALMYRAGWSAAVGSGASTSPAVGSSGPGVLGSLAWPLAGVSTVATIVLGVLLAVRGGPDVVERVVYVKSQPQPQAAVVEARARDDRHEASPEISNAGGFFANRWSAWRGSNRWNPSKLGPVENNLVLRDLILARGIDALPDRDVNDGPASALPPLKTRQQLLEELLEHSAPSENTRKKLT